MRIAHVTDSSIFNYDGISTYVNELLKCASDQGDPSLAIMPPPLDPNKQRKVRITFGVKVIPKVKFFSSDKFIFSLPVGMKKVLAEFHPDVVWIHTIGLLGYGAARLAGNKCRVLYTKHCFDGDLWCQHLQIGHGYQWFFQVAATAIERLVLRYVETAFYHFEKTEKIQNRSLLHKFVYVPHR